MYLNMLKLLWIFSNIYDLLTLSGKVNAYETCCAKLKAKCCARREAKLEKILKIENKK